MNNLLNQLADMREHYREFHEMIEIFGETVERTQFSSWSGKDLLALDIYRLKQEHYIIYTRLENMRRQIEMEDALVTEAPPRSR